MSEKCPRVYAGPRSEVQRAPIIPPEYTYQGEIQIILGPMFSGKTTELLRRMRRFTIANKKCIILKYYKDVRYANPLANHDKVSTHDLTMYDAIPCAALEDAKTKNVAEYDVIGVDEGQFYPDIVSFCEEMANLGKIVIISSLDGTFARKPFGHILELIPLAESVTKLTAICSNCQQDAGFSRRLGSETQIELIGGEDKYSAVCRKCYHMLSM